MLQQFNIKKNLNKELAKSIIDAWMIENNKIFHLISDAKKNDIREFSLCQNFGLNIFIIYFKYFSILAAVSFNIPSP